MVLEKNSTLNCFLNKATDFSVYTPVNRENGAVEADTAEFSAKATEILAK